MEVHETELVAVVVTATHQWDLGVSFISLCVVLLLLQAVVDWICCVGVEMRNECIIQSGIGT